MSVLELKYFTGDYQFMPEKWPELYQKIVAKIDVLKGLVWTLQNSNGSFPSDMHEENPDISSIATLSLYLTDAPERTVEEGKNYLIGLFHDGGAYRNPWLDNAEDPKITAVIVRHLRKIDPKIPELRDGIQFIENHIDEHGIPILPKTYRAQNPFGAAGDILEALPRDSLKRSLVEKYILTQQRSDGSFDMPVSWKDPRYKLVQLVGATRMECTAGVILTFLESLNESPYEIKKAVDYITPRQYPPVQVPVLTEKLLRRLPSPALHVVNATIMGNPNTSLDDLPSHKCQIVATVLNYHPSGIDQQVHVLRQLIRLQNQLYNRLH